MISIAPAGSAEALAASCPNDAVCFWDHANFGGTKVTARKPNGVCWNYAYGYTFRVNSLITGRDRGVSGMRTGRDCNGTPSTSYRPNVRVANPGQFNMQSFR